MKFKLFLVLILFLNIILLGVNNVKALPEANKTPFYDMEFGTTNGWWINLDTTLNDIINPAPNSYFEIAICVYCKSAPAEIRMGFALANLGQAWESNGLKITVTEKGFYVAYLTFYYTDAKHVYFAVYKDNGIKINEVSINAYDYTGTENKISIYSNASGLIDRSLKYWYKQLSSGNSYSFIPLYKALDWLLYDPSNPQIKVIRVESYTSPVSVQVFSSDGNKFYEQGFVENEITYIFANDTKVTVFAYGPAGSKSVDITENGLWIVYLNSSLTDIYLNVTGGEENQTAGVEGFWLNTTVTPSSYHIEYYVYDNGTYWYNASAVGSLEKLYSNGTIVKLVIKTDTGLAKYSAIYTITRDYNLYFYFEDIRTDALFNLTVKCYTYTPYEPTIANISLYDSSGNLVQRQNNVQIAKFTNLRRDVYHVVAEKSGYYTVRFTVDLNETCVYTVVFVDANSGIITPWDVETGTQTDVETYKNTTSSLSPPPQDIPSDQNWYGIHFIVINSVTKELYNSSIAVQIYAIKGISRANLWHDNVIIPVDTINVVGEEYWWITESDINSIIGKQLWEYLSGFRIVFGNKVMTIPADRCKNMFYNLTIYTDGSEGDIFGYNNAYYISGFLGENPLSSQLFSLLIPLMVFMLVMKIVDNITRRR